MTLRKLELGCSTSALGKRTILRRNETKIVGVVFLAVLLNNHIDS